TGYLAYFFPVLRQTYVGAISTATVIWLAALLNIVGPRLVTRFEAVTTLLGVGPIALVGLVGWFYFDPQIFQAGWNPGDKGWPQAVGSAFSIMFWAFMGVECASVAAGVVDNPQRNVPRATLLGVLIAAVIYVLATTAIMG